MPIPDTIRAARLAAGLTQKQVGEALGYTDERAQIYVGRWETGDRPVPKDKLRRLAKILNLTLDDLIP